MAHRGSGGVRLADRLVIDASARGVRRLALGRRALTRGPGRRHADRARRQIAAYLAGRRTRFSVPLDLRGLPPFQARVLAACRRIRYGRVLSYAALALRVGRPRAARAVGNALAMNPVPLLVPCHRVVRTDGSWRRYALGPSVKRKLLGLERARVIASRP